MKTNQNWSAESSILRILKDIDQAIVNREPIILSRLVAKHRASGTLSTVLKRSNVLDFCPKRTATWTVHSGKVLLLGDTNLHKLAGRLAEETREFKNTSRKNIESREKTKKRLEKVYEPLEGKRTTLLCKRQQEIQERKAKPKQIISLDVLLTLKSFLYEKPTCVSLFGEFFSNVQEVSIDTCEFAEYLLITLTQNNIRIQKSFQVEDQYGMIEDSKIGFGLQYV